MNEATGSLARTLAALADPHRLAIVGRLMEGEADVADLTPRLGISQPAVSRHLKVLEQAGLVEVRPRGQRRPRALVAQPLRDVERWLCSYLSEWDARFKLLDGILASSATCDGNEKRSS